MSQQTYLGRVTWILHRNDAKANSIKPGPPGVVTGVDSLFSCMSVILQSPVSVLHVAFALLALASGTWVVWHPKGTAQHRRVGYVYVASMGVVLATAFGIYRLFGRFGVVHWGAVACTISLLIGMGAAWGRTYLRDWLRWHYFGLSGSVAGLYTTFLIEATYRLFPLRYFWWTTVGTSMLTLGLAAVIMYRQWDRYVTKTACPV